MIALLLKTLGASEWTRLLSLVSPAFFRVVPLKALSNAVTKGVKLSKTLNRENSTEIGDGSIFKHLTQTMNSKVTQWQKESGGILDSGDLALCIYFATIFGDEIALLDVSKQSFVTQSKLAPEQGNADDLQSFVWSPAAVGYSFQEDFLKNLRLIYAGFYQKDDRLFCQGLSELGLLSCASAFKDLFGNGDQTCVPFQMSDFINNFHRIFTLCKENNVSLHQDFVALGVFLAFLYEHFGNLTKVSDKRGWNAKQAFFLGSRVAA